MDYQPQLPLPGALAATAAPTGDDWRLDDETRRAGRRGLAAARRALAASAPPTYPVTRSDARAA